MKIEALNRDTLKPFYLLLAEIEGGNHVDLSQEHDKAWFEKLVAEKWGGGCLFWGGYLSGKPLGLLGLKINSWATGKNVSAEILDIGVMLEARRKGYGLQLLRFAESYCVERKVYTLGAFTYAADYPVIAFYGKGGFVPVATLPDLHGPGDEGQVYMRKIITPADLWQA